MHVIILHLMNFALFSLGKVLILFFEILDDLSVVNLPGASFVDLLLSNLFDLEHDLVKAVLVDEAKS